MCCNANCEAKANSPPCSGGCTLICWEQSLLHHILLARTAKAWRVVRQFQEEEPVIWPQLKEAQLRRLEVGLTASGLFHFTNASVIFFQDDAIPGQLDGLVFHLEGALIDPHGHLLVREATLAVEAPAAEADIAELIERAGELGRVKHPIQHAFWIDGPLDPAQHCCRRVAAILPLLMGEMVLVIVIVDPLLMRSQEIGPGLSLLESVIERTAVYREHTFNVILPG